MNLRIAKYDDITEIKEMFQETILCINAKDYSPQQTKCWAGKGEDDNVWRERIDSQYFVVAEEDEHIIGFAALKHEEGYLNSLFVHKNYQNRGIATLLLTHIEEYAKENCITEITADVSITAKPFFERKGYRALYRQTVDIEVEMDNYKMVKELENISISKAEYNDLDTILSLQKIAFLSEAELYGNYQIEPLHQTLESIQSDFSTYTFLKAEHQGEIIGSVKAKVNDGYCWIGKLIVHPDFQRRGIGRRLLIEVENIFPETKEFHLFTGSKSVGNISLYESAGYEEKEEFYDNKNPDVILIKMVKNKS